MSKFKINLELTGLKLNIEGSREDIPLITQGLAQQLTGLIAPAAAIASGDEDVLENRASAPPPMVQEVRKKAKRKPAGARSGATADAADGAGGPVNYRHDAEKYGSAKQTWTTAQKAMWLLHVVGESAGQKELSAAVIASTFNQHFKQSGPIQRGNVGRDLGKLKTKAAGGKPPGVAEDTTKNPSLWYLTEEGSRTAQALVSAALGRT